MIEYGKLDFAVSFKPLTAFPLDSRSYFDSYAAAELAAAGAVEAGSSDGTYYFGQTISVVENDVASFYIIQPDKTLQPVAGKDNESVKVAVNDKQFTYTEDNRLVLKGFDSATTGQMLVVGEDGSIVWASPVDAYSKTETDSKINDAVAAAAHLKREIVNSKELIDINGTNALTTIYMVSNGLTLDDDRYDEYMVIEVEGERKIEKVGTWAVDLKDYAKKTDLDNYVQKNGTDRLVTEAEVEKWNAGEANIIASVSSDFAVDENRLLNLNNISMTKIINLADTLNKKVDAQDGYTLLSPTDQEKLAKLVVSGDNLEISGSVNASSVKELDTWIETNRNTTEGLFPSDAKAKLEALFDLTGVEFAINVIDDKKQLDLVSVGQDKVTGLTDTLALLASKTEVDDAKSDIISILENKLVDYVTNEALTTKLIDYATVTDVNELKDALTWKSI